METYILILFFFIALLYASVGFGGGSSYIAILALASIPYVEIRSIALCCNIVVVGVNIYHHWKEKNIEWKNIFLICSLSIPLAYIGSLMHFKETIFFKILGVSLILASVMMGINYFINKHSQYQIAKNQFLIAIVSGGIGFLSGITGIGGGIFLSPVLSLMKFTNAQKIVALCSLFIAFNSIVAMVGLGYNHHFYFTPSTHLPLILVVFLGGFLGNKLRFKYLTPLWITILTALLVFYVGVKLVLSIEL